MKSLTYSELNKLDIHSLEVIILETGFNKYTIGTKTIALQVLKAKSIEDFANKLKSALG